MHHRFLKHSLYWTPASEVWPNVFIADEKAARNKAKLEEMYITHIMTAMLLCSVEKKWEDHYQKKNITYYNVHSGVHGCVRNRLLLIKVLVYSSAGLNQSIVLLMAYLMIHQDMKMEDAFEFVLESRMHVDKQGLLEPANDVKSGPRKASQIRKV
ncbi:dual specificity phosphatase 29-like [Danio rerio]|uniref:Dual specificity phosphatase 29-like n=1 Tax=Danio rerio TaxID=7955 RepID=A0AC58G8M8_DANRE